MNPTTPAMLAFALTLAVSGCEQKPPEPTQDPAPPSTATPKMKGGPNGPTRKPGTKPMGKPAAGGVTWTKPEAWKDGGQRPMRLATFKIPAADGETDEGEVSVSRAMGSVEANVQRWRGQFKDSPEAKVEDKEINGIKTTLVEIQGTWLAGGGPPMMAKKEPAEPKDGWKMVVAMVHTEGSAHFFKMWGPQKTIDGARSDFDGLLASIQQK